MRFFATAFILCGLVVSNAQPSQERILVPDHIQFAGMTLSIREDARAEIQADVDALTQSPRYFNNKAERARTYFPIIERIFTEERVPVDFKFLAIQESALVADAVSVTYAVGFWQFKDFTASEMGLRVDSEVDERMNIVSSTRAAARYIKQNNYMFNNWVYALQAYQMGAGGVKRMVGDEDDGSRSMEITVDTYWYVKKYLAHKVAFEQAVGKEGQVRLSEVEINNTIALHDLASRLGVEESQLRELNKWVRKSAIPGDRPYVLVVPSGTVPTDFSVLHTPVVVADQSTVTTGTPGTEKEEMINDVPVIQAREGETLESLASRSGLNLSHFLRYNDLPETHDVVAGGYYFKANKKSHSDREYHQLAAGETLWSVSQMYGIHVKKLRKFNRLGEMEEPASGTIIWLSGMKPRSPEVTDNQAVVTVEESVMDWSAPVDRSEVAHVVSAGETLYGIARKYNTTVESLRSLNHLESNDLGPGQRLIIVDGNRQTDPDANGIIHEVKPAETLYSVAKRYGVSVKELMESNNKTDFSVALGEKLRIPAR